MWTHASIGGRAALYGHTSTGCRREGSTCRCPDLGTTTRLGHAVAAGLPDSQCGAAGLPAGECGAAGRMSCQLVAVNERLFCVQRPYSFPVPASAKPGFSGYKRADPVPDSLAGSSAHPCRTTRLTDNLWRADTRSCNTGLKPSSFHVKRRAIALRPRASQEVHCRRSRALPKEQTSDADICRSSTEARAARGGREYRVQLGIPGCTATLFARGGTGFPTTSACDGDTTGELQRRKPPPHRSLRLFHVKQGAAISCKNSPGESLWVGCSTEPRAT